MIITAITECHIELEKLVVVQFVVFVKKCLLGKCIGISFVDSTPLRVCRNQRIHMLKGVHGHSEDFFNKLFIDGIHLITKLKNNMKGGLRPMYGRILLRKRAIIETINDELKNIAQIEHSRHRPFPNFIVNLIGGIVAFSVPEETDDRF